MDQETYDYILNSKGAPEPGFDFYGWQTPVELYMDVDHYLDVVKWIVNNIPNVKHNLFCSWGRPAVFRFRKSKDKMLFVLRWS